MKARQKWDLLVLNSKDFVNFVISNLRNFEKFYTLKNSHFLYERKILDFPIKLAFFHYFNYLTCFEIYSIDAAWKTESNKCISKHVR
jgi:hypothetical protein